MNRTRFSLPLLASCLWIPALSAQDGGSALRSLPKEAAVVVQVPKASKMIEKLKESPVYALKDRSEFAGLFKQIEAGVEEARNQIRAEVGMDLMEMINAVQGELLFVVGDIGPLARTFGEALTNLEEPAIGPEDIPILMAMDTQAGATQFQDGLDKLLDYARKKGTKVDTSDFHSAKMTAIKLPEDAFDGKPANLYVAKHGSRYVMSLSRKFVEQTVVDLEPGSQGKGLFENEPFRATYGLTGKQSDAFVYVNVKALTSAVNLALSGNMFAFFWQKFEESLIGKSLQNVGFGMAFEKDRVRGRFLANNGGADDGMLGWFKGEPFPAVPPAVIPEDTSYVYSSAVDVPRAAKTLREIAELVLSMQGQMPDVDAEFQKQFGMQLSDFIGAFGDRIHAFGSAASAADPVGGLGIIVELKDDSKVQALLGKLPEIAMGMLEKKRYMDRDIFTMATGEGVSPSLCATDGLLVFALQQADLEKVVRRVGKNLPGVGDSAEFKKIASLLPARVSGLSYASEDYFADMMEGALKAAEMDVADQMPKEFFDLLGAFSKTMGTSVSYGVWKDEGFYSESVVFYRK